MAIGFGINSSKPIDANMKAIVITQLLETIRLLICMLLLVAEQITENDNGIKASSIPNCFQFAKNCNR